MIFQDNPYFSAGFGLLGVGAGLAVVRRGAVQVANLIRRRMICTMEVTSRDPLFQHILNFAENHRVRHLGNHFLALSDPKRQKSSSALLHPGPGSHYFKFNNRLLKMERNRERAPLEMATPFETLTLSWVDTLPKSDARAMALSLANQASLVNMEREEGKLLIYTSFANEWRLFGNPRRKRPLESVVLQNGQLESIMRDLENFLSSAKWYYERGIPYRRGYLLHGPPGGGKSSLIHALASHLDYGICVMGLAGDAVMTDDRLQHLMHAIPERCILLLEDIDAATTLNRPAGDGKANRLSLSGLLNAIDGVAAAEERIIFMTTNHPERLDAALVRPGRIDFVMALAHASPLQAERMFRRFYTEAGDDLAKEFGGACSMENISPAEIQGLFIKHSNDPRGALREVTERRIKNN